MPETHHPSEEPLHELPPDHIPNEPEKLPSFPNIISDVEHFFGDTLGDEILEGIRHMPEDQFEELWSRCTNTLSYVNGPYRIRGTMNDYGFTGEKAELWHREAHMHERLLRAGLESHVLAAPGLKQAALFCGRTLIRDTVCRPIPEEDGDRRQVFASRLRDIEPIAALIRSGIIVPYDSDFIFWFYESGSTLMLDAMLQDPLFFHLYSKQPELGERLRDTRLDFMLSRGEHDDPSGMSDAILMRDIRNILRQAYPWQVGHTDFEKIAFQSAVCHGGILAPITPDPVIARHFRGGVRTLFGEPPMDATNDEATLHPFVEYSVPSLIDTSPADIVKLRQNEAIFTELQTAFTALAKACAEDGRSISDFASFERVLRAHAKDVIEPIFDKLMRWQKRASVKKWGSAALGGGASLLLGLTPLQPAGKPAGEGIKHFAGRRAVRQIEDLSLAASVLKSFL